MTLLEQAVIVLYVLWLGIVGWGLWLLATGAPEALKALSKPVVGRLAGWTLGVSLRVLLWTGHARKAEPTPEPVQVPCNCRECHLARLRMASALLRPAQVEVGRC